MDDRQMQFALFTVYLKAGRVLGIQRLSFTSEEGSRSKGFFDCLFEYMNKCIITSTMLLKTLGEGSCNEDMPKDCSLPTFALPSLQAFIEEMKLLICF